jgi:hypothetical protein
VNNAVTDVDHDTNATDYTQLPVPAQDDRVFLCGQSGRGKTVLLKDFLSAKKNFHLVDTKLSKAFVGGGGIGVEVNGEEIYRSKFMGPGKFVWHTPDTFNVEYHPEAIERYCDAVYQIGNRVIALDEFLDIGTSSYTPFSVNRLATRGRERGIGLWAGTQRPAGILPTIRTEANHKYQFYVEEPDDQDRMDAAFGRPLPWAYLLRHPYSFFYRDPVGTIHGPFRLALPT